MTDANGNMVMPVAPYYGGNGDGMFGGNNAWWVIILLILFGGFGNGFNGNGNGVQRGFDQSAVMNGLSDIQAQINANQAANANQSFQMQSAFQNCCCENRLGTADLKYTMATEAAATRANCDNNKQQIMDKLCQLELDGVKQNYEVRLANKDAEIANLYRQLAANSQANQTGQILQGLRADNAAQTIALEQHLNPTPVPAYIVQNPNCCQPNYGCGCGA